MKLSDRPKVSALIDRAEELKQILIDRSLPCPTAIAAIDQLIKLTGDEVDSEIEYRLATVRILGEIITYQQAMLQIGEEELAKRLFKDFCEIFGTPNKRQVS